jgi:hypothetical protein
MLLHPVPVFSVCAYARHRESPRTYFVLLVVPGKVEP